MGLIKRAEQSSHWYHRDGTSCHEVIAKTTGLPRPTNVKDARKLDLVPSVTNVLGMKAKPALTRWMQDNAILSALSTERKPGELEPDWHSRIAEESSRIGREAAAWGTALHDQIEQYCLTGAFTGTGEILDYVAGFDTWFRENVVRVISAEQSVVHPLGYAGRLDLYAIVRHEGRERRAVIDYKSQKLKGKAKGNFYKEWQMQLMAYGDCLKEEDDPTRPLIISIIIPSDKPGGVQPKVWVKDNDLALEAFRSCHKIWCYEKSYTP
jgi:hypothetical protein